MPTVRYQIRNEYGLADPEVYRAAEKDDPEALLEGVAMAGLVGILRQLGDLAQFAAEVFHDLHEEVMATSARGHGLILRVQQLDAEFPFIEKDILSQIDHSLNAYNAGIDWHPTLRVEQNLIIQGDMPRFILDSYEECRGPPQLFMLDKFDVAGAGACLTRYSNPSFFKTESASSEIMESELQREKRPRKIKKGSNWRNDETTNSFFMPIMDYSQFIASEPVPEKFPSRLIKLKHRNLRVSDLSNKKSYMEGLIHGLVKQNDPKISLGGSNTSKVINGVFEADQILNDSMNDPSQFREEVITQFSKEVTSNFKNVKRNGNNFLENAKEEDILMALSNEIDIHDFDISSDENDSNPRPLQLREPNNLLVDPGFITDVDHDSCGSDDVGSELENYVDALNMLETEVETDSEIKVKSGPRFFNSESQGLNPNINGHLELQPEYSGSDFDTRVSSNVVDLASQLQLSTIFEESFGSEIKINQVKRGKFDRAGDCKELVPLACFPSDEACYQVQTDAIGIVPLAGLPSNETFSQKLHNVTMLVPVNRDTLFSSSEGEPALKLMWDMKQTELLGTHSVEVNEHVDSFLLPWKPNHVTVPPTFKENPDAVEEDNIQVHSGDRISETIADKDHILSDSSKDDEIAKTLQMQEHEDKSDGVSGNLLSSTPMGSILKSYDTSIDMEFGMHPKYSTMKITSAQSSDEIKKLLNCNVLLPAAPLELSTLVKDDNGSHESTQTLENVGEDLAYISDEGLKVSAECVTNQSRESSACSFEIFSSTNLQLECLVGQFSNIVATPEEFLHPQSPASAGDVDIFGGDASTSPSISVDLERYPVDKESQQSANLGIDPLISRSAQLQLEAVKLIETNDNHHAKDELEITNASTKVDLNDELLVGESKIYNKPLDGNVIIDNGVDGQVINMLESEKAFCSDLLLMIEDSVSKDEVLYQLSPDDESIIRRETIFSPLENKPYCKLIQNEDQDMFMNSVSSQKSTLDMANFFVTNLKDINVDDPHVMLQPSLNEDNMCSTENKQESDPIAENAITEDDTDKKLLSMLQSSNLCSFDGLLLEVPVAESATLNEYMPEIEYLDTANHDSQPKNDIAEIGTDHQNLSLLETSDAYGFEEAPVFEDASLNQHKLEFEAPAITCDLTSSKFEKDFFAPFSTKGGREEPFSVVSSSQSHTIYSSYNANAMLPDNNCDDIVLEFHPSVYERSFNEQASYSVASLQPFQTGAERLELQPDTASVSEPSTRSLPAITLDDDCSDKLIRCNLEHDMLITQPEPEAFCEHGSNKELCMPSAKAHAREQIEIDLSVPLSDAFEPTGSVMASKDLTSKSIVADSSSPISLTSTEEPPTVFLGETISGFSLMEGIEEAPHLPPLPPIQWIMGKPMMDTNPCTYSSNVHMDEHAGPFKLGTAIEDKFPCVSPCTDFAQMTNSAVFEHGHNANSNIAMEGNESYGLEERRPKLVKLLPSLELERSQEASIVDTDAVPSFNPFMFIPITGDQTYHYDFKDYVGYDGGNQQHHSFSSSFPVSVHGFPHYGYHSYDITLPQVEGDNQNGKPRFIRNRQRDPLIEAVAAHDKSTLRKVSDVDHPLIKSKEETNYLLEQIKNKSSNLKPATSAKASILKAPSTNLKVAAILQKANAIRQACVGSDDEDDDDNWS